jgi:hypothetical protein
MRTLLLTIVLVGPILSASSCSNSPKGSFSSENRYYAFCCQQLDSPGSVEDVMRSHGFDCAEYGYGDISIRGTPETRLRARELALRFVSERGWKLGWIADSMRLDNQWDELGGEKGPWKRVADVKHRVTPTAEVLLRIDRAGMPSYFEFGLSTDLIFVHSEDVGRAMTLLRLDPFPGVAIHESP